MKTRSYWNSCPRQLDFFPEASCPLGKRGAEAKGDFASRSSHCAWYLNSEEDHYCFWKWIRRMSNKDGHFEPRLQHQVAELLKCSSSKSQMIFKEALTNFQDLEEFQQLKEFY